MHAQTSHLPISISLLLLLLLPSFFFSLIHKTFKRFPSYLFGANTSSTLAMELAWFNHSSINLDLNIGGPVKKSLDVKEEMGSSFPFPIPKNSSTRQEVSALEAELGRVSEENKRLNEKLAAMQASYSVLQNKLIGVMAAEFSEGTAGPPSPTRKRKRIESMDAGVSVNGGGSTSSGDSCKRITEEARPKISKLCVRTEPSDASLVVKDGYQWRKYGQKVTRDNPCPRAYFKCSFAPACPVKKKVQRSAEDRSILVATYEGEHTHARPSPAEAAPNGNPCSVSIHPSGPTVTLDLTQPRPRAGADRSSPETESPEFQRRLAEEMATSLTKNPTFTAALASALSGRFLRLSPEHSQ